MLSFKRIIRDGAIALIWTLYIILFLSLVANVSPVLNILVEAFGMIALLIVIVYASIMLYI